MVNNIEWSDLLKFKIESLQQLLFHLDDFFFGELFAANFVINCIEFKRVDLLILGCSKHRCDANQMQIRNLQFLLTIFEELVHISHTSKETLFAHLVGRKDFNHPINHFGSEVWSNLMLFESFL